MQSRRLQSAAKRQGLFNRLSFAWRRLPSSGCRSLHLSPHWHLPITKEMHSGTSLLPSPSRSLPFLPLPLPFERPRRLRLELLERESLLALFPRLREGGRRRLLRLLERRRSFTERLRLRALPPFTERLRALPPREGLREESFSLASREPLRSRWRSLRGELLPFTSRSPLRPRPSPLRPREVAGFASWVPLFFSFAGLSFADLGPSTGVFSLSLSLSLSAAP